MLPGFGLFGSRIVGTGGVVGGGLLRLVLADGSGRAGGRTFLRHYLYVGGLEAMRFRRLLVQFRRRNRLPLTGQLHLAAGIVLELIGAHHLYSETMPHVVDHVLAAFVRTGETAYDGSLLGPGGLGDLIAAGAAVVLRGTGGVALFVRRSAG